MFAIIVDAKKQNPIAINNFFILTLFYVHSFK